MSLSSFSIKRPVAITMFYLGLAFLGIYSFSKIGVDLLPNISLPHLIVQTTYSNATPEEIEKLVTEPLESAAGTVTGVKNITSVSKEGISVLSVDFLWGTNMDYTLLSLREKLDNIRFALPREAGRPTIIRVDPSATPIMTLSLSPSPSPKERGEERNFSTSKYQKQSNGKQSKFANENKLSFVDYNSSEDEIKRLIDLKEAARVVFKRRLEQIDGVAQAVITGGLEREILIEADPQKLNAYNLTFDDISAALKASNVNLPAGSVMKGLFRYSLRTIGEYKNLQEIEKTILKRNDNGSVIQLSDVVPQGGIKESFEEREGLTRLNGSETIGILINKEPESNTVDIAQRVRNTIISLRKEYPEFKLAIVSDHSQFIENAITNVKQEIYYGGILAFLVLFFFLASLRNVFIIGITIPASLILTILLMNLFNISFNIISLGGIALGIGMLLDNAIIVIENVTSYREKGLSIKASAIKGTNEVAMPIVASTLTTIAVFLPLVFLKGITAELFRDQSYAVAFSLAASIIVSLTLVPMLASRERFGFTFRKDKVLNDYIYVKYPEGKGIRRKVFFWLKLPFVLLIKTIAVYSRFLIIKSNQISERFFAKFFKKVNKFLDKTVEKYETMLAWALDNKRMVLLLTIVLIIITIFAAVDMKKEFIPDGPQDEFVVELVYPPGTSLRGNAELTGNVETVIKNISGISDVISNIGRVNEFDFLNREQISVNKTNMIIKIEDTERYYKVKEKVQSILEKLKGIKYSFKPVETSYSQIIKPSKNDIVIKIKNKNIDAAFEKGNVLVNKIRKASIEGKSDVRMGIEKGEPEYKITINREKCLAYGITVSEAANQIVNLVKGNEATYFTDFDKKIGIKVRTAENNRDDIEKILANPIKSGDKNIPIKNVVDYKLTESYNEIWHEGQSRTVYVYADLSGSSIDNVINEINKVAKSLPKQQGEIITIGGANDEIRNSFSILYVAIIISILLMYIVLASEFESFLFPFIIIFSVPLGLIGGILLLYIFGESINIISLMGLVILIGIADNDAVVKVEFILRKREEGLNVRDAIVAAGKNRFRPIVMNSFTVIFGLIPMMVGIGAATQLRISLSLAIAGGLISSTFLTLIVIPVLYTYLERFSRKKFSS
ncbi:MAG: efflux RND transporter permease subunit [Ignavibacteriales bacterium]|nr:efflux RND transporter permease subunit [Ignavibacteriales bacterium]